MWYRATYLFLYSFFRIFHRLKIYGRENIPKKEAFIIVSNHMSYYDPPLIWAISYPRIVNFMAKEQFFKIPGVGLLLRSLKAFPIKTEKINKKALSRAMQVIKQGGVVGVFPEGTRIKGNKKPQIFHGASFLALKTTAPVLPVGVIGTDKVVPEGARIPRAAPVSIRFGKPINFDSKNKIDLRSISNKIMQEINGLKEKGY